jgi:outer membrane protein OmpA-like peptidoglycan-associated protein
MSTERAAKESKDKNNRQLETQAQAEAFQQEAPVSLRLDPVNIMALQRTIGNQAVQRLLANGDGRIQRQDTRTEAPVSLEQAEAMFDQAMALYEAGQYRRAIITFERVRQIEGLPEEVRRDCLYNIGMSNLRLERFATATIYFEQYLTMPGADLEGGERHLQEARQGAGTAGETPDAGLEMSVEQAENLFDQAMGLYESGEYRRAVILFERVRQAEGLSEEVQRDCLYNMGMSNLRLERFATAIIYFEQYLTMTGADVDDGEAHLAEAHQGMASSLPAGGNGASGAAGSSVEIQWEQQNPAGRAERVSDTHLILWNYTVGADRLKPEHQTALRQFVQDNNILFLHAGTRIQFVGHASSSGAEPVNLGVAMNRAITAAGWVAEDARLLSWDRVTFDWRGEGEPRVPNTSPENMAMNRRVEIRIIRPSSPRPTEEPPEPGPSPVETPQAEPPRFQNFSIRMIAGGEGGEAVGGGVYTFEIRENGPGGRTAMYTFVGAGITGGFPAGGYGPSSWSDFTTSVPMRVENFEGGGRIASAGAYAGGGVGYSVLVFYCGDFPEVQVEGFGYGAGLAAGASWFHGWWEMRD